jgi:FolB domain-containing protein
MDKMSIRDIKLKCIIGTRPIERKRKQWVVINVALDCDLRKAGRTDRLEDTVNYKQIKDRIAELVEKSRFFLLEKMADRVADICLKVPGVKAVTVTVDKPGALTKARSAAVEIRRRKKR